MGSFNTTCFASQQTIGPQDACVVVPILQRRAETAKASFQGRTVELTGVASTTCYPAGFWRVAGGFFDATYADYGDVVLADTPVNRRRLHSLLNFLLKSAATVEQGENSYHDLPFDLSAFLAESAPTVRTWLASRDAAATSARPSELGACWDYVWGVAFKHRLFAQDTMGMLRPMEFAIMHRSAYDLLVAQGASGLDWNEQTLEHRAFFDRVLAKATRYDRLTRDGDISDSMTLSDFRMELQAVGYFEGISYPDESAALVELLSQFRAGTLTHDQFFEAFKPYLDARYAVSALAELNVKFVPNFYASQDYDNQIGRAYAKFIRAASAAVNRSLREQA